MAEVTTKSEDLWTPYKELFQTIKYYLEETQESSSLVEFETLLKKHKQNFFALLVNPPKNAKSREELRRGMEEGIAVRGIGHQILSKDLYQEAIILSDMFDMNEFVALDLLCTAQMQKPYYLELPRGLVAVLLYYDGRKALLSCLRMLVQARAGIAWVVNARKDLQQFVTAYTNMLMDSGLFPRIFELLRTIDLSKELQKLQENLALGGPRHRRQVIDLFTEIRQLLAEIVFLWSAQCGLPKEPTVQLIAFLSQYRVEETAEGRVDNVSLYLLYALLAAMDLSVLHSAEDTDENVRRLPIIADTHYLQMLCDELSPNKPQWVCEHFHGIAVFALCVTVTGLDQYPHLAKVTNAPSLDVALSKRTFTYLLQKVLDSDFLHAEQFLYRRTHFLLTDFIINMMPEIRYLRAKADSVAHTMQAYSHEGITPPSNLPRYFEELLMMIHKLYDRDPCQFQLMLEYWSPAEINPHEFHAQPKSSERALALYKFILFAGDAMQPSLFVAYLRMLGALANCPIAARNCFNMLKQSQTVSGGAVTWDHFFTSFQQYYANLREEATSVPAGDTVYRRALHKGITPHELEGLHAVLYLMRRVAEHDDFARMALCEHPSWSPLTILLGLVGCAVPIPLKADLLLTLGALSLSPETATYTWNNLEQSQILVTVPTTSSYQPRGLVTELEEIETRMEEYPLSRAFVQLLHTLVEATGIPRTLGAGPRTPGFDPYLTHVVSAVFLKFNTRPYKNAEEKWRVARICLQLFDRLLAMYEPQLSDLPNGGTQSIAFNAPPGFHLMLQLHTKSQFLNLVLFVVEEAVASFQHYVDFPGRDHLEHASLCCLRLIERALSLQSVFFDLFGSSGAVVLVPLNKLVLAINPRSGTPDYCYNITKYVMYQFVLPQHALIAIRIVTHILCVPSNHAQYVDIMLSHAKESKRIRSGFVECLDLINDDECETKEAVLQLLMRCLPYAAPNFTHFLLGFNLRSDVAATVFQLPGVLNCPRTCIHSIFSMLRKAETRQLALVRPTLLEMVYKLLYALCAHPKTSEPVLKYLRLDPKFFEDHLTYCVANALAGPAQIVQLAWLLKTAAIELKVSSERQQFFHLQQFVHFLTGMADNDDDPIVGGVKDTESRALSLRIATAPDQKQACLQRMHAVLMFAIDSNNSSAAHFVDAWRHVVGVLAGYLPFEVVSPLKQQLWAARVLHTLLAGIAHAPLSPDVAQHLSGTVLMLLESLRRSHQREQQQCESLSATPNLLVKRNPRIFQEILQHLLDWIMRSDASAQNLRVNLYASLICFLHLISMEETDDRHLHIDTGFYVARLDSSKAFKSELCGGYVPSSFLAAIGEKLIELVCYDCVGGHDIGKMLAMTTFTVLLRTSGNLNWLNYVAGHGFLKYLIHNVLNSDDDLKGILEPVPTNLKLLYLYAARMALLTQIACTHIGAELLLEHKLLSVLSNMSIYNLHPEILRQSPHTGPTIDDYITPVEARYLQILLPTFSLCNAILTSLGTQNRSASIQILYYLFSHFDVIELILRSGSVSLSSEFLRELSALTAIVARTATNDVLATMEKTENLQDGRAHLYRIQKMMVALLPKFYLQTDTLRNLIASPAQDVGGGATYHVSNRLLHALKIVVNLLTYVRNLIENNSVDHAGVGIILQPSLGLVNVLATKEYARESHKPFNLGIVVQYLLDAVNCYHKERQTHDFLQRKLSELPTMSTSDLNDLMRSNEEFKESKGMKYVAFKHLKEKFTMKRVELRYYIYIVEHSLYILWAHLDFYMLKVIPNLEQTTTFSPKPSLSTASEAKWKVSVEEIGVLKQRLFGIMNDSFSKKLLAVSGDYSKSSKDFIEALLRKIKRLVQFVPVK